MKEDNNKNSNRFPVKEGKEESSILHSEKTGRRQTWPNPELKDKQEKNQPEFIEEQPNHSNKNK